MSLITTRIVHLAISTTTAWRPSCPNMRAAGECARRSPDVGPGAVPRISTSLPPVDPSRIFPSRLLLILSCPVCGPTVKPRGDPRDPPGPARGDRLRISDPLRTSVLSRGDRVVLTEGALSVRPPRREDLSAFPQETTAPTAGMTTVRGYEPLEAPTEIPICKEPANRDGATKIRGRH